MLTVEVTYMYGIRQKECNKRVAAALISAAYRVPSLSLCVHCTLTLFLKVRRLIKRCNPWHFSRENVARFTELRRLGKKSQRVWQKVPQYASRTISQYPSLSPSLPLPLLPSLSLSLSLSLPLSISLSQIQRQTIKVVVASFKTKLYS